MSELTRQSNGVSAMKNSSDMILDEIEKLDDKTMERFETLASLLENTLDESHQKHNTLTQTLIEYIHGINKRQQSLETQLAQIHEETTFQNMLSSLHNLMEYQANLTSKACQTTLEMSTTARKQMDDLFIQLMPALSIQKQLKELQLILNENLANHNQGSKQYQMLTAQAKELLLNLQQTTQKLETYPPEIAKSCRNMQDMMATHLDKALDKITDKTDNAVMKMQTSYRHQPVAMSKGTMWLWATTLALLCAMLGLLTAKQIWSLEINQYARVVSEAQYYAQQFEQLKAKSQKR